MLYHHSIVKRNILGEQDVLTHRKENDRHTHIYCRTCGAEIQYNQKRIDKHQKRCTEIFHPLREKDPVLSSDISEYTNLAEQLQYDYPHVNKRWSFTNYDRTLA